MNLENLIEDWMGFISMLRRKPISWLSLLAPPFLHILGASFFQVFLTSSAALFLSSFFFFLVPVPKQHSIFSSSSTREDKDDLQQREKEEEMLFSYDTESSINTEDSEYVETTTDISDDGSISDEESLIELSLPSGHYVGNYGNKNKEEDNTHKNQMFNLQKKIQDLRLFEFNDMIEEDNLIEIDISIGSIKCSRFEIAA